MFSKWGTYNYVWVFGTLVLRSQMWESCVEVTFSTEWLYKMTCTTQVRRIWTICWIDLSFSGRCLDDGLIDESWTNVSFTFISSAFNLKESVWDTLQFLVLLILQISLTVIINKGCEEGRNFGPSCQNMLVSRLNCLTQ